MKTAEELFKELGYKIEKKERYIMYYKYLNFSGRIFIEFNFNEKMVEVWYEDSRIRKKVHIDILELIAINKQCEELGWL